MPSNVNSVIGSPNDVKFVTEPLREHSGTPYILFYRQGNNPHPQFFLFYHPSHDIRQVVERVKRHCEQMNYRFVNVRPFVVDLDAAESRAVRQSESEVGVSA